MLDRNVQPLNLDVASDADELGELSIALAGDSNTLSAIEVAVNLEVNGSAGCRR